MGNGKWETGNEKGREGTGTGTGLANIDVRTWGFIPCETARRTSSRDSDSAAACGSRTTHAPTTSPYAASGTATAAASRTAGCAVSAFSICTGNRFCACAQLSAAGD